MASISQDVPSPVILQHPRRMTDFAQDLWRCGYDLANCAKRFGVYPRLGVNFWHSIWSRWISQENDPVDTLLRLTTPKRQAILSPSKGCSDRRSS